MEEHRNNPRDAHTAVVDERHGQPLCPLGETCWLTQGNRTGPQGQAREQHREKTASETLRRIARENAWQIGR